MYTKFLTARSPLRLLEKGLHGGLGKGNLGLVLAGPGVGKTSFLVGVALDDLIRGDHVLHVALDQTVAHTRDHYDTVFEDLVATTQLEDEAEVHAAVDRGRSIRAYASPEFNAGKLAEALRIEEEAGVKPALVIVDGIDRATLTVGELAAWQRIAQDLPAEIWISMVCASERIDPVPAEVEAAADQLDVILALEPGAEVVGLRAIKDHDNPDVEALRVALDPRTMLLKRN